MKEKSKMIPLYSEIISLQNILSAWQRFVHDKKKKIDIMEFNRNLMDNLYVLHTDFINNTYTHGSYTHFTITDPKKRDIHKSPVRDRIVHHMLYTALYPYFDTQFIYDSYSCRINKGTHRALERFKTFHKKCSNNNTKTVYVLKCDIKKFFASIDHHILMNILQKHITDVQTMKLLENIVGSFGSVPPRPSGRGLGGGDCENNTTQPLSFRPPSRNLGLDNHTTILPWITSVATDVKWIPDQVPYDNTGLPLGNLTSQLLVNVYMNIFDQYMKHMLREKYYIRYADDFVIMSQDKNHLQSLIQKIQQFLNQKLKLNLHPNKVSISTVSRGVDFLGWVHFPYHRVLRTSTRKRMFRNLEKTNGKPEVLASYRGLLQWGDTWELQKTLINLNQQGLDYM